MARKNNSIEEHSKVMSLLGEKLSLIKMISHINKEIEVIDRKLDRINKKKMFTVLKGEKK